jgi:hypothetical protein
MKSVLIPICYLFVCLGLHLISGNALAESIVNDLGDSEQAASSSTNNAVPDSIDSLPVEIIKKQSASGRILILTNANTSFEPGDYLTLLINKKRIVRGVVAKLADGQGGVKIVRKFSDDFPKNLRPGTKVQVIRGDDSWLDSAMSLAQNDDKEMAKDERDLLGETSVVEDDIAVEENSKRAIKQDNLVGASYGKWSLVDNDGEPQMFSNMNARWAYQPVDNFWGEFVYGESLMGGFPAERFDTKVRSIILRFKYTVDMPFYSCLQPYFGYQFNIPQDPGAGSCEGEGCDLLTQEDIDWETELIQKVRTNKLVFGATINKRLVPGWFITLDIGTDTMSGGLSVEF